MNILIVHNKYKQRGGEDVVVENEISLLKEMGFSVFEYIRSNDELDDMNIWQKLLMPFTTVFSVKSYKEVKNIIIKNKIDIMHVHNTLMVVSPSVFYAGFKCKIPVYQTIHNFRMLCPNGLFFKNGSICEECIEKGLKCAIKNKCYRNSRIQTLGVVCMIKIHRLIKTYNRISYIVFSQFSKDKLLSLNKIKGVHIPSEHIHIKPNFISLPDTKMCTLENSVGRYYLYVGRLSIEKGNENLVKGWMEYKKIYDSDNRLIVCGTGPEEEKVRTMANGEDTIIFLGNTAHEKVLELMREAVAVIVPSICYEGCPMTIIEAFSVACPILGSNIGNINEIIREGYNGLKFDPFSPVNIANTIAEFDASDHEQLHKNAADCYKMCYSEEVNKGLFRNIYDQSLVL